MSFIQVSVFFGFLCCGMAGATGLAQAHPAASTSSPTSPKAMRKVVRSEAEIKRLEREVKRQESDSQRASDRLQQQDSKIAELQKQLQELQSAHAGEQH